MTPPLPFFTRNSSHYASTGYWLAIGRLAHT